jgi:hypothetical protein
MEDQAFSQSFDVSLPRPDPPPFPVRKLDRRPTGRLRTKDNLLTRQGEGGGRTQIIRQRESLVLYKSFNTL